MMSTSMIRHLDRVAMARAAEERLEPMLVEEFDLQDWKERVDAERSIPLLPNLGDLRPPGWRLVDQFMCDSSGFGLPSEPALTLRQMLDRMEPGMAYAVISCGQFQVWVAEFVRDEDEPGNLREADELVYCCFCEQDSVTDPDNSCANCGAADPSAEPCADCWDSPAEPDGSLCSDCGDQEEGGAS